MIIRIYIEQLRVGARGPMYRARLDSMTGPVLVEGSTEPFLAAARELLAQGITGQAELWRAELSYACIRGDIAQLAKLTVKENERTSPIFVPWRPFPFARSGSKTAVPGEKLAFELSEIPAVGEEPPA